MRPESKDILKKLGLAAFIIAGLKIAADDAEEEYRYREGQMNVEDRYYLRKAEPHESGHAASLACKIILGNPRAENGNMTYGVRKAISSDNFVFLVDSETGRDIGFVFGHMENLTRGELNGYGCRINNHAFSKYEHLRGFKGFALGIEPEYRNQGLGLILMNWMKTRAKELGADYIWLGAYPSLNNRQHWLTRTDLIGEANFVIFFANMVDVDLFEGRI